MSAASATAPSVATIEAKKSAAVKHSFDNVDNPGSRLPLIAGMEFRVGRLGTSLSDGRSAV